MKVSWKLLAVLSLSWLFVGGLLTFILLGKSQPEKKTEIIINALPDTMIEINLSKRLDGIERKMTFISKEIGSWKTADTFASGDSSIIVTDSTMIANAPIVEESFNRNFVDLINGKPYPRFFDVDAIYQGFLHNLKFRFRPLSIESPQEQKGNPFSCNGSVYLASDIDWEMYGGFDMDILFKKRIGLMGRIETDSDWNFEERFGIRGKIW